MSKNIQQHIKRSLLVYSFIGVFVYSFISPAAYAALQSTTYQMNDYSFGSGGTTSDTSSTYSLFGVSGQPAIVNPLTSTTYQLGPGLTYQLKANVPGVPTLATPANNYDRIKITLDTGNNPADTLFAIQLSTASDFSAGVLYAKNDFTAGTTLTASDYKTNANWGASGFFITGLTQSTTYYVRVKASQGNYSESEWGPSASTITHASSLSFTLGSTALNFNQLSSGNSFTDATQTTTLTTTTNAYNGYIVYGYDDKALTNVSDATKTIANFSATNSTPTSWSGTGFGYTTNDANLQTGSGGTNRFSTGTLYAGFTTSGPGDPVADDLGPVQNSQISAEQFTISYRVTANSNTVAGTYKNTIIYTIVPAY